MLNVKVPLYFDRQDIYRVYVKCLEHRKDNIFELVPNAQIQPGNITPEEVMANHMSPKLSKSSYGVMLFSDFSQVEKFDQVNWLWEFHKEMAFKADEELSRQLQIVPDEKTMGKYYLAPNIEMFVTRYLYLFDKFSLLCCRNSLRK